MKARKIFLLCILGAGLPLLGVSVGAQTRAPGAQTVVERDGLRFMAGNATAAAEKEVRFAVEVENLNPFPVPIAVLSHRDASARVQAEMTDAETATCEADRPTFGIADISRDRNLASLKEDDFTVIPPKSRNRMVFRYRDCRLSAKNISFAAEFLVLMQSRPKKTPISLWGIERR